MSEHVIIRQKSNFETEFRAQDPHDPESDEIKHVIHIHQLTPYTMLLASLGACTAIVMNTYAQNHDVALNEVELHLRYQRVFQDDCENCEEIQRYEEQIDQEVTLYGDLTDEERQKLFHIAQQCSVHKMLEAGIEINTQMSKNGGEQ
jgi:putative redox protein